MISSGKRRCFAFWRAIRHMIGDRSTPVIWMPRSAEQQRCDAAAACQVARRFYLRQNIAEDRLPRRFIPREMKGKNVVVILGQPSLGPHGFAGFHVVAGFLCKPYATGAGAHCFCRDNTSKQPICSPKVLSISMSAPE
jgi:hypothetical protein